MLGIEQVEVGSSGLGAPVIFNRPRLSVSTVPAYRRSLGGLEGTASDLLNFGKDVLDKSGLTPAGVESALLSTYEKEVKRLDPYLEQKGRQVARVALAKMLMGLGPKAAPEPAKPTSATMVERIYQPVLDPVMRGATDEASKLVKPLLAKALLGIGGLALVLVILGRVSKSCR